MAQPLKKFLSIFQDLKVYPNIPELKLINVHLLTKWLNHKVSDNGKIKIKPRY